LKKQPVLLLILLSLATVFTAACGDSSSSVPQFTALTFISNRTVTPPTTLFWSKLDGSAVTAVPLSSNNVYYPSISADGTVVAFYSNSDAWVQKTDGSGALNLTTTTPSASEVNFVRISPNGKLVLFSENNADHIHLIKVDGTGDLDLTPTFPTGMNYCYSASFNAGSTLIAFVCEGATNWGIYTIKPDGTAITTVTGTRTVWTDLPSFTPDGKKIIFVGTTNDTNDIESVNLDGSGDTVLIPVSYEATVLNSTLYYTFNDTTLELNQVYKAGLDGSNPVSISDGLHDDYLGLSD